MLNGQLTTGYVVDLERTRIDEKRYADRARDASPETFIMPGNTWNGWIQLKDDYNLEDPDETDAASSAQPAVPTFQPGDRVEPIQPWTLVWNDYAPHGRLLWDHERMPATVLHANGERSYLVEHADGTRRSYYATELHPLPIQETP